MRISIMAVIATSEDWMICNNFTARRTRASMGKMLSNSRFVLKQAVRFLIMNWVCRTCSRALEAILISLWRRLAQAVDGMVRRLLVSDKLRAARNRGLTVSAGTHSFRAAA